MTTHLRTRGLTARYGSARVLHGLDITVRRGCVTAILGANGAGKTTLLRAISRALPTEGDIELDGRSVVGLKTEDVARLGVAHVPDGRGTFTGLTAEDNLRLGAHRLRRAEMEEQLEMVYGFFPKLKQRRRQQAGTLSGGEQQMLAIGRALMSCPRLMMFDEPSVGLAPILVKEIFSIMRAIRKERGVSMLLVDQNAARALDLADDAYVLETGRVVLAGPAAEVASHPSVRAAYLGA
ncbi:ABC transporter ATP-binding protein [Variovorax sp. WS11]|uniref:ABC transporter ATP-binding protein n=1 Tax=Variovorax sp. WS11 TaxID=1105204 RepID=UPI000D0DFA37|nr:ABC transporter ATP-binding protein [Variovorax sp. WS11]NDZ17583.1 ABC transporter ATP-binding protein [Variovorax sp. WS11]PSL82212.1 ABC transporter ATP-binding protein [Variovorax sp. WS11]